MFECVCAWPRGIETYRECVRTPFLTHTGILTFKYTETKRRALPLTNTWRDANSYTCRDTNTLSSSLTIALKLSSKRYYKWLVYQTILLLAKRNTVLKVLPFKRLWAKHTSQQPFIQVSNLSFKSTPIIPCERKHNIFSHVVDSNRFLAEVDFTEFLITTWRKSHPAVETSRKKTSCKSSCE